MLIAHGANIYLADQDKKTALDHAKDQGNKVIEEKLVELMT